ncbi:carbohydrate porin [Phenylobacterium sp.]|uniref:carbohydrate porin n=1 Tax=Phenylobacterium sp. TaxID=1871053 RepID=UPI002F3F16D2
MSRLQLRIASALLALLGAPVARAAGPPVAQALAPPDSAPESATQPSVQAAEPKVPAGGRADLLDTTLSVEGDLADSDAPRSSWLRRDTALAPWFAWKQGLQQSTGLGVGGSWGLLWQNYSSSQFGARDAVGSKVTINLSYGIANRGEPNALTFDMAVEDRRPAGTDRAPLQAGIAAGSAVPTAATWGEFDLGVTQAYIRQNLADNHFQYAVGKLFAPNFVDAYPFFDDNRQFLSLAFSTSPTIAVPLRGFGLVGAAFPTDGGLYLKGGMFTALSDDTGWTVDNFFNKDEHFYFFETGWSGLAGMGVPIQGRGPTDRDNFHITTWYRDPLSDGSPRAYGVAANANFMIGENNMWFLRGGWSEGWLANWALSGGLGHRPANHPSDLFGVAFGWVEPSNKLLDPQYTGELFYRFHVTQNLAFTPDFQIIFNPSLAPTRGNIIVLSMRGRVTF